MKLRKVAMRSIRQGSRVANINAVSHPPLQGTFVSQDFWPNASAPTTFRRATKDRVARVQRSFTRFVGVDLGGGRGKTTAIAEVRIGSAGGEVVEVATRSGKLPWTDDTLMKRLAE